MNYLLRGISECIIAIPFALIVFGIYYICTKFILKKKIVLTSLDTLCKALWIIMLFTILSITGILENVINKNFRDIHSIISITEYIDFYVFRDGLTLATILNLILFIPFGILTIMIFKKFSSSILIGLFFSIIIEFVQVFIGRFVQLEDIFMNTLGCVIGCFLGFIILKLKEKGYILTEL
ncbi:VanZ family protein [Terrisporobacter vanillatitrophus]|uniref:VanZ family protein n=1 Tax=Terrisporobacter vanillatitrophus TaxID=3058402 RepID=UPI00336676F4